MESREPEKNLGHDPPPPAADPPEARAPDAAAVHSYASSIGRLADLLDADGPGRGGGRPSVLAYGPMLEAAIEAATIAVALGDLRGWWCDPVDQARALAVERSA